MSWYYNIYNKQTGAVIAVHIPAGFLDGKDLTAAEEHIRKMNENTPTFQRYELFRGDTRTQRTFL